MGKIKGALALSGILSGMFVSGCGLGGGHGLPPCQTERQIRGSNDYSSNHSSSTSATSTAHCTSSSSSTSVS